VARVQQFLFDLIAALAAMSAATSWSSSARPSRLIATILFLVPIGFYTATDNTRRLGAQRINILGGFESRTITARTRSARRTQSSTAIRSTLTRRTARTGTIGSGTAATGAART